MMTRACRCVLVALLGSTLVACPAVAGEWRDTFDDDALPGWTQVFRKVDKDWTATWEVKSGLLHVRFALPPGSLREVADFLEWTVRPIDSQHLKVRVRSLSALDGGLGVFLGRRLPAWDAQFARGYLFSRAKVVAIGFSSKGKYAEGRIVAMLGPFGDWRLFYDGGRFRLVSEETWLPDVVLTEFEDATLPSVDVVGLLAAKSLMIRDRFHGWLTEFVLSGPQIPNHNNLPVEPRRHLATTWGKIRAVYHTR